MYNLWYLHLHNFINIISTLSEWHIVRFRIASSSTPQLNRKSEIFRGLWGIPKGRFPSILSQIITSYKKLPWAWEPNKRNCRKRTKNLIYFTAIDTRVQNRDLTVLLLFQWFSKYFKLGLDHIRTYIYSFIALLRT